MRKNFAITKVLATATTAFLIAGLGFGLAANAVKPTDPGKPSTAGKSTDNGKPADSGKPADAGKPIDVVGNSQEIGKPSDNTKGYIDVKTDGSTGKPVTAKGKATFGNVVKLSGAQRKAAALAKAQAKKDNGNKVNYIVRFNEAADFGLEMAALKSGKAKIGHEFQHVFKGALVGLTDKQKAALAKRPSVASITEDLEVTATETQTSPAAWGIDRIDQAALPLSGSYSYGGSGAGVNIYVVDTGIRSTHSEFSGRVQTGYSAIADANGTEDCNGHGTHVSSTAAGARFGVAKSAILTPVRVLGCDGSGTTSGVIAGLDWIAGQVSAETPAVVNMSLGGGANSSLDTAVAALINRGITVVVAAGNSKTDSCTSSPARVAGAITVAASTNTDTFANYSNFGSCVDLIAPGSGIVGAWITGDNDSATLSGTSMATPHVAGVSAVLLGGGYVEPNLVTLALTDAATLGAVGSVPAGTVNKLLFANPAGISVPIAKAPLAPVSVSAIGGKRSATVSWTAADNSGLTLKSQIVHVWAGGNIVGSATVSASATSTILKLRAGVSYSFSVVSTTTTATSLESPLSNAVVPTNK